MQETSTVFMPFLHIANQVRGPLIMSLPVSFDYNQNFQYSDMEELKPILNNGAQVFSKLLTLDDNAPEEVRSEQVTPFLSQPYVNVYTVSMMNSVSEFFQNMCRESTQDNLPRDLQVIPGASRAWRSDVPSTFMRPNDNNACYAELAKKYTDLVTQLNSSTDRHGRRVVLSSVLKELSTSCPNSFIGMINDIKTRVNNSLSLYEKEKNLINSISLASAQVQHIQPNVARDRLITLIAGRILQNSYKHGLLRAEGMMV